MLKTKDFYKKRRGGELFFTPLTESPLNLSCPYLVLTMLPPADSSAKSNKPVLSASYFAKAFLTT